MALISSEQEAVGSLCLQRETVRGALFVSPPTPWASRGGSGDRALRGVIALTAGPHEERPPCLDLMYVHI